MQNKLGDKIRLQHVLDAINEIDSYLFNTDFELFMQNSMMRFACIKQLEIIGEACNHVSENTRTQFSDIQWAQIVAMRNVFVHEYFGIDSTIVWQIIKNNIPYFKSQIIEVLQHIE